MKRLMITLSAAAMAFGLFADGVTLPVGEAFTGLTDVPASITSPGDSAISEVAYTLSKNAAGVPDQFVNEGAGNNLAIKTPFNAPAYYEPLTGGVSMNGLYFDSLVKFTACDEDAVVPDGSDAKIMVWVKEDETAGTTNLMVTAGYFNGDKTEAKIYDCGPLSGYDLTLDGTQWCRLTIKAYDEITTTGDNVGGFVLFVNAKTVTMSQDMEDRTIGTTGSYADSLTKKMALRNASYALFPSMAAADATTITGVGFAGQGAVDDLSFTDKAPTTDGEEAVFTDDPVPVIADVVVDGVPVVGATFDTAASIVAFVADNCASASKVEITLTDDCEALNFSDATFAGELVIDLAGKNIVAGEDDDYAVLANGALKIVNTGDDLGSIVADEEGDGAVASGANVTIDNGIIVGAIQTGETIYINGGKFSVPNEDAVLPTNYIWVEPVDPEIYWTIREVQQFKVILVSNGEQSEQMIEEGESLTDPGTPANVKAWQTFIGWFDENQQQVTFPLAITANTTLTAQNKFLDGEGTAAAPWQIETEDDLIKVQKAVAGDATLRAASYLQTANIALTTPFAGIGLENGKDSATTTDFDAAAFQGTYDGAGFQITGLQLTKGAKGTAHDYAGLFNSIYQATIKNVTVGITGTGWAGDAPADGKDEWAGAPIVGVCKASLIENCSTLAGTFTAKKAASGIAAYVMGGSTLKACTNNLAIVSEANEKAAGLIACAQKTVTGVENGTIVYVEDCANYGNVTVPNNKDRAGGFVSYTDDVTVTFKGDCTFSGTLTGNGANVQSLVNLNSGNVAVADGAVIKVPAGYKTVNQKAVDGVIFATVDGNVATLVKNAALAAGGSYRAMSTGATAPAIELAADEQIVFDESLFTVTATAITAASGCELEDTKSGNIRTIKAKSTAPAEDWDNPKTPIVPGTTKAEDAWPSLKDTALAQADAAKLAAWAKDTTKGNITFDKADEILVDAFLLDCANTAGAVATAKAAFKVTSITQDENGDWVATVGEAGDGEAYKNGFINIVPYELEGAGEDAEFFQATLTLQPVTKE